MSDEQRERKVASVLFSGNGSVFVCDDHGEQMADLQAPPWMVFLSDLRRRGLLPDDATVEGLHLEKSKVADLEIPDLAWAPRRRRLPDERQSVTVKFKIAGHKFYMTVGMYPDGTPGEMFLKSAKEGSSLSGLFDSFAITFSMGLQFGVPLADLCSKFSNTRFEPSGFTGREDIPYAKSPMDFVARWLALRYLPESARRREADVPMASIQPREEEEANGDGPLCSSCGHLMRSDAAGTVWVCTNCSAEIARQV